MDFEGQLVLLAYILDPKNMIYMAVGIDQPDGFKFMAFDKINQFLLFVCLVAARIDYDTFVVFVVKYKGVFLEAVENEFLYFDHFILISK
jgi:hypothetical protein